MNTNRVIRLVYPVYAMNTYLFKCMYSQNRLDMCLFAPRIQHVGVSSFRDCVQTPQRQPPPSTPFRFVFPSKPPSSKRNRSHTQTHDQNNTTNDHTKDHPSHLTTIEGGMRLLIQASLLFATGVQMPQPRPPPSASPFIYFCFCLYSHIIQLTPHNSNRTGSACTWWWR